MKTEEIIKKLKLKGYSIRKLPHRTMYRVYFKEGSCEINKILNIGGLKDFLDECNILEKEFNIK